MSGAEQAPQEAYEYRCHSCGRRMFYADKAVALRSRGFCSLYCLISGGPGRQDTHQERNDHWFWLRQTGMSAPDIARLYGVKPQLVYKAIHSRHMEASLGYTPRGEDPSGPQWLHSPRQGA